MGVNFGYSGYGGYGGYGMMNGMNMMSESQMQNGACYNTYVENKQKYGCEHCFPQNLYTYRYPVNHNPVSTQAIGGPSLLARILRKFTGG